MDGYRVLGEVSELGPSVLATLVHVEGHAYRKPGAFMLLAADGRRAGSISPGCLEADLQERVSQLLETGRYEWVEYNMRAEEDAVWGEAVGCGGAIRILLEPVGEELRALLMETHASLSAGEAVRLSRHENAVGWLHYRMETMKRRSDGGQLPAWDLDQRVKEDSFSGLRPVYTGVLLPPERLILFGAGDDMIPVGSLADRIGFRLAVVDWRTEMVVSARFPGAELFVGAPDEAVKALRIGKRDYVLIGSHQLAMDRWILELLLPLHPAYIGIIGSSKRIGMLFEALSRPDSVMAPVGLPIGAEGPEEIAVSIAAELIAVRSGRKLFVQ